MTFCVQIFKVIAGVVDADLLYNFGSGRYLLTLVALVCPWREGEAWLKHV